MNFGGARKALQLLALPAGFEHAMFPARNINGLAWESE